MNRTSQTAKTVYMTTYWVWIALFVIAPLFLVLYYSFFDIEGNLSLENYRTFFTSTYLTMTLSSFWYAFLITFFSLLIGYPTAYLLTKTKHKQLWLLLIILPSWINLLLKAYAFLGIFGTYGITNQFFRGDRHRDATDFVHGLQFRVRVGVHLHPVHDFADL